MSGIKSVFGGAGIRDGSPFGTPEGLEQLFEILKQYGVKTIDTAQLYGPSEGLLGTAKAGEQFIIDTKATGGFVPGSGTKDGIITGVQESLKKLHVKKVDIFYLHAPDASVPISETLAGINEAYKSGAFERFGLSNYKVEDVQKVYAHCKENNYVLPTVYQGNFSPVAQLSVTLLFPTLRKYGISFYAYSPLAGGFLTKTKQQILDGAGRFNRNEPIGNMYANLYSRPAYLEALEKWDTIAKEAGCSPADLAYRWVKYNSPLKEENGDAIIIGARNHEQLKQTLEGVNAGPLSDEVVKKIADVWKTIEHEAPLDNYNG